MGERRRQRWTGEKKARVAAESFENSAKISEAARLNGVSRGLSRRGDARCGCGARQGTELRANPNWLRKRWRHSRQIRAYFDGKRRLVRSLLGQQTLRGDRDRDEWSGHPPRARREAGTLSTVLWTLRAFCGLR
ncbi:transposase [Bradyrhizobium yuanmingense]|uniref:transposase n=1 Tax=Bradyrhizobium yuanmingense TaxID=108015 RepID=UPI0012F87FA2|nr:transposase [Bradyrhizobium yuanmingense]